MKGRVLEIAKAMKNEAVYRFMEWTPADVGPNTERPHDATMIEFADALILLAGEAA